MTGPVQWNAIINFNSSVKGFSVFWTIAPFPDSLLYISGTEVAYEFGDQRVALSSDVLSALRVHLFGRRIIYPHATDPVE